MPTTPDPLIGQVLSGQYRLDEALGHGGMGTVYRGTQLSVGRAVAIKVINAEASGNEQVVKRFQREAQTLSKLTHPNTVRLFDYGVTERQQPFMVMELLQGFDVATEIAQRGAIEYQRALLIALQVLRALEEAHALGVTHRDLKPSNIFLSSISGSEVHARVLDFGIAGLEQGDGSQKLTVTGLVVGSAAYMSPEQAQGQLVGPASDLYSLGAVLFEMLTGTPPFKADTLVSMLVAHITQIPPRLEVARPELPAPPAVQELLDELLAKSPEGRPSSAHAVAQRIEDILAGNAQAPRRDGVRAKVAARVAIKAAEAEALVAARLEEPHNPLYRQQQTPPYGQTPKHGQPGTQSMPEGLGAAYSTPADRSRDDSSAGIAGGRRQKNSQTPLYAGLCGLALLGLGGGWFGWRSGTSGESVAANASLQAVNPVAAPVPSNLTPPEPAPVASAAALPPAAPPVAEAPKAGAATATGGAHVTPPPRPSAAVEPARKDVAAERAATPTPAPAVASAAPVVVRTPPVSAPVPVAVPAPIPPPPPQRAADPDLVSTDRTVRRQALLRSGLRYNSVSSAKAAYSSGALNRDAYEDTVWVLKAMRENALRAAKADLKAHKIDKQTYRARLDEIEARYRGL